MPRPPQDLSTRLENRRVAVTIANMLTYITPLVGNLMLWLWLAAVVVSWRLTRGRRNPRLWVLLVAACVWLAATRPVTEWLAQPLEGAYERPDLTALESQGVRQVVVLTGGGYAVEGEPFSLALPNASSHRFLGGLEACRILAPDGRIIFSGSAGRGHRDVATAEAMAHLARRLAPELDIRQESRSGSTAEHPLNVAPLLNDTPFLLVTSAYHLRRAMDSFRRAGYDPIAYPVDLQIHGRAGWTRWLPSFDNLATLQLLWREYLAWVLYEVRGW